MLESIWHAVSRRARFAAAAVALGAAATAAHAQDESPYSFSFGVDFTSHFVSYGADVWGGGDEISPFSPASTIFGYGTMNVQLADNLSAFVNVWTDLNDNVDSEIGGAIQEIDVNTGIAYTFDKFTFSVAHGFWIYAGDEEKIIDFVVSYDDSGLFGDNFALNPSFTVHWRYDGNGAQEDGVVLVPGIRPTITINQNSSYPITLAAPISVAFFSDDYHGGDSGFGYFSIGGVASIPLAFIPEKWGAWSASASLTYYCTESDVIPGNPEDQFLVSAISIGVAL